MAKPPVCKIMDYGRHKYQEKKRANEAKKKQTVVKLKEIKFRPKTEEHDYAFKVRQVREVLEEGNKARITVMFRGREITHREIGQGILKKIELDLKDIAVVEQTARLEGRLLFMILSANPRVLQAMKQREQALAQHASQPKGPPPAGATAPAAPASGPPPADGAPAPDSAPVPAPAPAPASAPPSLSSSPLPSAQPSPAAEAKA
jgi:translation initiation factor IF-3